MTRVAAGKRVRAYKPKTRTGCLTCKIRRVKCDETQPSCEKCMSTGRKCDGYSNSTQAPKPPTESPPQASSSTAYVILSSLDRIPISPLPKESRSFDFFLGLTGPQLSGFFPSDFWNRFILQAAHHEPAIKHGIIALGALHERFVRNGGMIFEKGTTPSTLYLDRFAVQQYDLAIKSLVEPVKSGKRQAIDVFLIACLVFACFETMLGSYGSALKHMNSGAKMLCEMESKEESNGSHCGLLRASTIPYVPMETLDNIFLRLNLQVSQMIGRGRRDLYERAAASPQRRSPMPSSFSSLSEAREWLVFIWHKCTYIISDMNKQYPPGAVQNPQQYEGFQKKCLAEVDQWSSALDSLLQVRGHEMSPLELKGASVLKIQVLIGFTSIRIARSQNDDQTVWDPLCPIFKQVVTLAAELLDLDKEMSNATLSFSFDMAIVGPLYDVASRCRDPVIRRKAIALLRASSRDEGVWNSVLTAKVAKRGMQIEEEGLGMVSCCADVPDWARISHVKPMFDPIARKAILRYSRATSANDVVRETVEEVFEW